MEAKGLLYNSDEDFETLKNERQPLKDQRAYGPKKVLFPSNAGDGESENHMIRTDIIDGEVLMELHGNRVRTYYDYFQEEATPNVEFECQAMMNDEVDNISLKAGNHTMADWEFGGYGVDFKEGKVESKVEFNHIGQDSNNGKKEKKKLSKKIKRNVLHGFKYRVQNVQGQNKKILNAWIKYPKESDWTHVMKNRIWEDQEFLDNNKHDEGKKDTEAIKRGVYLGLLHRCWVRCNSEDDDAKVFHNKVRITKIGDFIE